MIIGLGETGLSKNKRPVSNYRCKIYSLNDIQYMLNVCDLYVNGIIYSWHVSTLQAVLIDLNWGVPFNVYLNQDYIEQGFFI